jgi:hypothetical protein
MDYQPPNRDPNLDKSLLSLVKELREISYDLSRYFAYCQDRQKALKSIVSKPDLN